MKHINLLKLTLILLAFILPSGTEAQQEVSLKKASTAQRWIDNLFTKGKLPPFSFTYGEEDSETFIRKWDFSRKRVASDEANVVKYEITYSEPGGKGLEVRCDVTGFTDFEAVEWTLHFTNKGDKNSKNIKNVSASNILFSAKSGNSFTVYTARGSNGSRHDFAPVVISPESDKSYTFSPKNGRSSDTDAFPFFNIATDCGRGAMLSIGWTGTWIADFSLNSNKLHSTSGMKNTDLFLYPGESIRTPLTSLMFWSGNDRIDGQNKFRKFILAHHTHKINGKNITPPMCGGFEWGDPAPCNEYACLTEEMAIAMIKRHKQFGLIPEVFWLDAGWYEGAGGPNFEGKNWYNTVGSWRVDKERFPNGLKPISKAAHDIGAKFMVWFEPERVYKGSFFYKNYPQWLITSEKSNNAIFDLGNKEACDFLCKYIGDFIEENGIDYYRQDFNMPIAQFWEAYDEPQRKGMREIRYVEGLYAYWDYLLNRFPGMIIDNCASGGRRIDLETTSRSIPLWRTDYRYGEVNGYQCHTYGLNFFLPLHGTGLYGADNYNFRSSLSAATVTNWELTAKRGSIGDMQKALSLLVSLEMFGIIEKLGLTREKIENYDEVLEYKAAAAKKSDFERTEMAKDKTGVPLKGIVAINPVNNKEIPVWISD